MFFSMSLNLGKHYSAAFLTRHPAALLPIGPSSQVLPQIMFHPHRSSIAVVSNLSPVKMLLGTSKETQGLRAFPEHAFTGQRTGATIEAGMVKPGHGDRADKFTYIDLRQWRIGQHIAVEARAPDRTKRVPNGRSPMAARSQGMDKANPGCCGLAMPDDPRNRRDRCFAGHFKRFEPVGRRCVW